MTIKNKANETYYRGKVDNAITEYYEALSKLKEVCYHEGVEEGFCDICKTIIKK